MPKIKTLQKVGSSRGIVIDKPILQLLNLDHEGAAVELEITSEGLLLKPSKIEEVYQKVAKRHRQSLDKLGK